MEVSNLMLTSTGKKIIAKSDYKAKNYIKIKFSLIRVLKYQKNYKLTKAW